MDTGQFRDLYFSISKEKEGEEDGDEEVDREEFVEEEEMTPVKREATSPRSGVKSLCLLCSSEVASDGDEEEEETGVKRRKRARLGDFGVDVSVGEEDSRLLVSQLEEMFILLRLLDVPKHWCKNMLLRRRRKKRGREVDKDMSEAKEEDGEEPWFDVCSECIETNVTKAWDLHQNIVALQRKLGLVKEKVKERMRRGIEEHLKVGGDLDAEQDMDRKIKRLLFPDLFGVSTPLDDDDEDPQDMDTDDFRIPESFCSPKIIDGLGCTNYSSQPIKKERRELRPSKDLNECADLFVKCELEEMGTEAEVDPEPSPLPSNFSASGPDYMGDSTDTDYPPVRKLRKRKKLKPSTTYKKTLQFKWKVCRTCDSSFKTFEEFDDHLLAHEQVGPKGEFSCPTCQYPARTQEELKSHNSQRHKRLDLKRQTRSSSSDPEKRKRSKGYDCPRCPLRTETWKHLKQHVDHQHPTLSEKELELAGLILKCQLCGDKQFDSLLNLINHQKKVHSEARKPFKRKAGRKPKISSNSSKKAGYLRWRICRECDTRCKSQEDYDAHRKAHEENLEFSCPHCTFPARTSKELESHLQKRHEGGDIKSKPRPEKKCYDCPKCPLRTEKWKHLKEHVAQEHSSMTEQELEAAGIILKCHLCGGKEFENIQRLTTHKRKVHPELEAQEENGSLQPIVCPECGLKFASKKLLENHDRSTHKRQAKFVCDECGIGFTWQSALDDHKISHLDRSQKKQVVCDLCGIDFNYKHQLKRHNAKCHPKGDSTSNQIASDGTTPPGEIYKCRYCPLTSPIALVIKRHLETHKEELGHRCEQCGKCYTSSQGLSRHVRINHSNETWSCPHCAKKFPCEEYMKDHVKRYCQLRRLEVAEQGSLMMKKGEVDSTAAGGATAEVNVQEAATTSEHSSFLLVQ